MADDHLMTAEEVADYLGYTGDGRLNSAWRWLRRRGIEPSGRQRGSHGQQLYSRAEVYNAKRNMRGRRVDLQPPPGANTDTDSSR